MHICHNYITVSQNYLSRLVETISYFSNNQKKKTIFKLHSQNLGHFWEHQTSNNKIVSLKKTKQNKQKTKPKEIKEK